ncbi:condensin complex subunit 2/barren [Cunninghamella echinulata]|nr:condensin complex subunit 2/barren [Cunninghamella echinulata]
MLQKRSRDQQSQSSRDRLTRNVLSRQINPQVQSTMDMPSQLPVVGTATPEQMYSNFEEWIKMATDNKINAANSWNFALIDYFHEMTFIREGDSINFQRASCTLDGCVKIYTSRVDSVASETGKLLTGLADSSSKSIIYIYIYIYQYQYILIILWCVLMIYVCLCMFILLLLEDGSDELDMDREEGYERRARRRNNRSESTLLKDFSSIALKKLDVDFSVDPLFKKTSADFDEGGARGLLLNHLNLDQDCKIIFDSSDARPEDDDDHGGNITTDQQLQQPIDLAIKTANAISTIFNDKDNESDENEDEKSEGNGDISEVNNNNDKDEKIKNDDDNDKDINEVENFHNQLQMGSQLIMFDDPSEQALDTQEVIDISNLKAKIPSGDLFNDLQICPTLLDIDFFSENAIIPNLDHSDDINKDKDETMTDVNNDTDNNENPVTDEYDYGFDAFDFNDGEDDNANDNDAGELMDPFANDAEDEEDNNQQHHKEIGDDHDKGNGGDDNSNKDEKDMASGNIFKSLTSNQENELFTYFDTTLSKNWAGPEHWKLRKIKKATVNDSTEQQESQNETRSPKKKNTGFVIDFLEGEDVKESQIFAPNKAKSTLQHLKDTSVTTLPDDQHFSSKQLLCYYLKPAILMTRKKFNKNKIVPETLPELSDNAQAQDDRDIDFEQDPDVQFWADQQPDDILQDHDANDTLDRSKFNICALSLFVYIIFIDLI